MEIGIAILVLVVVALLLRRFVTVVVVYDYERGLRYARGRLTGTLEPGVYSSIAYVSEIRKVDTRPVFATIAGQEVLSSDGVGLKVSLAAKYNVVDPVVALNAFEDFRGALHLELQLALRQVIGGTPIDDLLATRAEIGTKLHEIVAVKVSALGLQLTTVELRDIMFPGELKKVFTQVVRARQEGLAALEKARGETAALRNLANAAQLVERNPHLMQLRLLQVLGQQSGNTVVLGVQSPAGPIPIRSATDAEIAGVPSRSGDSET